MSSKKTLVAVLVALVAVIAVAGAAYGALGSRAQTDTNTQAGQADSSLAAQQQDDAAADDGLAKEGDEGEASSQDGTDMEIFDFTVKSMLGVDTTLSSLQGKPTVVGFWATWCPPCNAEAPTVQQLYDAYGDRVNFMMVDATDGERETEQDVRDWLDDAGYTYPVYLDTNGMQASYVFQVVNLPTTVVFDADGTVVDYFVGAMSEEGMQATLDGLL